MRIGLVSDTHGYVDPRLSPALAGVEAILHAGDVGSPAVIAELRRMAPLYAVYGNNDENMGGLGLPLRADFVLGGVRFHLVHQRPHARPLPDTQVVVFGHSHRPLVERRDGMLFVNPGAAGRAGFHRLQTIAVLDTRGEVEVAIVELGARLALSRRTVR
jgi:putative phosphoesterase